MNISSHLSPSSRHLFMNNDSYLGLMNWEAISQFVSVFKIIYALSTLSYKQFSAINQHVADVMQQNIFKRKSYNNTSQN